MSRLLERDRSRRFVVPDRPWAGRLWAAVAALAFACFVIPLREITLTLTPFHAFFMVNFLAFLMSLPFIATLHSFNHLKTAYLKLHVRRAALLIAGWIFWLSAMPAFTLMGMTAVLVLVPILAAALGWWRQRQDGELTPARLQWLGVALVGAMLAQAYTGLRLAEGSLWLPLWPLGAAVCWAGALAMRHQLEKMDSIGTIHFYQIVLPLPMMAPLALLEWRWLAGEPLVWLTLAAFFYILWQFASAKAEGAVADTPRLLVDLTRLPLVGLGALLVWGEAPGSALGLLGIVLMVVALVMVSWPLSKPASGSAAE